MSFECFKETVAGFIEKSGESISPRFINDLEHERFIAKCSDVTIIARPSSGAVTVRYGSGHQVMVKVA